MNGSKNPSLDNLALFAAVVEARGFSAAARSTGRPQATVSRRIAALERDFGLPLLDRTTRRMSLTETGRRVYEHARLMRDQAEAARAAVAEMGRDVAGDLKVTAPVILGQSAITPIVAEFLRNHPRVNLQLEWTTRRMDPAEEDVDVAIMLGLDTASDAVRLKIGTTRARLFAPPSFDGPLPKHPEDLRELRILGLGRALSDETITFRKDQETVRLPVPRRLVANDVRPLMAVAETTGHIAVLPDFCAPDGWQEVLPEWDTPEREVNALRTRSRGALPKVRAFLEALSDGFAQSGKAGTE